MKQLISIFLLILSALPIKAESEIIAFHLNSDNGLPDNNIQHICQDSVGYIYFWGRYNTFRYDGYTCKTLTADESKQVKALKQTRGNLPNTSFFDNKGNEMRLLATGDLEYKDIKTNRKYVFNVCTPRLFQLTERVKCTVITDRRGLIWVSTNGSGLRMYNPHTGKLQTITRNHPNRIIPSNHIISMMEDRDGNIWISGEYHGVTCLKIKQRNYDILNINTTDAEKGNQVRMLHRVSNQKILVADMNGTVWVSEDELQTMTPLPTDGKNYISACVDSSGALWLGSRADGLLINGRQYGSRRTDCILKDSKGRMWTCGLQGCLLQVSVDRGVYSERTFLDIQDLQPRMMIEDSRGDIWLASKQGLFVFNPDTLMTNPKSYAKMLDSRVMCVYESSDHKLWVGTSGHGVFYADNHMQRANRFKQLSTKDGLSSNIVQLISENEEKTICIGTENGLSFYNATTGKINNMLFSDNRLHNIFIEQSVVKLYDGRMAFGSLDGIIITDKPKQQSEHYSHLLITDMEVNGVAVVDCNSNAIAKVASGLEYYQNSLTFSFSNLNYGRLQQTTYQCLLEGYEKDWVDLGTYHTTTYKQLKPGNYTLHVRSRDMDGGMTDGSTTLAINIATPWWASWWGYIIYITISLSIIYVVYCQLRRINQLRQAVAIEKQLTDYKLKFFTNISHEFRTPLTLIQGSMDKLSKMPESSPLRVPLSNMQRNVDRMLRLINQLLEFRRMQNNKLSLSLEKTDIITFLYNLSQSFRDAVEEKNIVLTFLPSRKTWPVFIDRGFVDKAVYNLLSNAFKYTPEGGSITLRIKEGEKDKTFMILVEDTGIGVPEEQREKIFDRFSRGQIGRDSIGIGLDLTAELIHTHKGTIRCEANPGGGSVFIITLPSDHTLYEEKDFIVASPLSDKADDERIGYVTKEMTSVSIPFNNHRILVVEDDREIASYLKQELSSYFLVEVVDDGAKALELLHNNSDATLFNLIITDGMMPGMSGFDLLKKIRKDASLCHLPVIMLTALNDEQHMLKGLDAGADAYITKPFSLSLLLLHCRNILQRSLSFSDVADNKEKRDNRHLVSSVIIEDRDHRFMQQIEVWVDSHLSSPDLSVDRFAEDMGYGRTTFYSKLKTLTGFTPNEYIKERRLLKAYNLLSDERITVAEVAYQVGMSTPQYLSTTFKKRFGITPVQLQKG